jgi:hypothetical protein
MTRKKNGGQRNVRTVTTTRIVAPANGGVPGHQYARGRSARSSPRSKPRARGRGGRRKDVNISMFNGNSNTMGNTSLRNFPSGQGYRSQKRQVSSNDEFIANVQGSSGFTTTSYPVNPGLAATFPWGAKQASLFQKYRVRKLLFYYKPTVSAYGNGGQSGKVMLSHNYDALAPPPVNKQIVEDTYPHSDAMPYENCQLVVVPQKQDSMYVRTGSLPMSSDIKTYDLGNLSVSVEGSEEDIEIGELRVFYEIELTNPVLDYASSSQPAEPITPQTFCCADFTKLNSNTQLALAGDDTTFVGFATAQKVGGLPVTTPASPGAGRSIVFDSPGCYCVDFSGSINLDTSGAANSEFYVEFSNNMDSIMAHFSETQIGGFALHAIANFSGSGIIRVPTGDTDALDAEFAITCVGNPVAFLEPLTHLRIMKMS